MSKNSADRIVAELRPTIPADVLRLWADDAAAELRRLDAVNRELLDALREIEAEASVFGGGFGSWISGRARAAIAKATDD